MTDKKVASPAAPTKFEVPGEWKSRCDLIRLTPKTKPDYIPLHGDFLKAFLALPSIDFSLFFAAGWDMYEVIRPKDFSPELVKEVLVAHKQNPASTRICIRRTDVVRYERVIGEFRRKKFQEAASGGALAHEAPFKLYAELSTAGQTVIRGMIDGESYNNISRASSSTVMNLCSSRDALRFLVEIVGKEPSLYDHAAITALVSACIVWNVLKLPKRESKLTVQSALLHDIERHCGYLGKPAETDQISQGAIKEISVLVAAKTGFHDANVIVMQQYRERFGGGGYPHGLKGTAEKEASLGINRMARAVTIGCGFSEYMLKRKDKVPLDLATITKLMLERAEKGDFDPEMVQGLFEDMKTGQIRRITAESLKDDEFDDLDD